MKTMRQQIEKQAEIIRHSGEMIGISEAWMILPEEMEQLGITENEWPLMAATYDAYLAFLDIVGPMDVGLEDETVAAERQRWPRCFNTERLASGENFSILAEAWVGLTADQSAKAYRKMLLRSRNYFS